MKNYYIIDRISNNVVVYNDKIDFGFALDSIILNYSRYYDNININYYNNYSIVSIRLNK